MKLGVIGYGRFGQFMAEKFSRFLTVQVYDPNQDVPADVTASLDEVCKANYLMLAIPLKAYESVLKTVKSKIGSQTIVLDVASVKLEPIRLIKRYLPRQPFIATHPLFGPESAAVSLRGHTIIFCESNVPDSELENLERLCIAMGLHIEKMSADEHDRQMATVQSLTFFIAQGLSRYGLDRMKLSTPSFERLLQLADLDKSHSEDLLDTIFRGNPYAREVRRKFIDEMDRLDRQINTQQRAGEA